MTQVNIERLLENMRTRTTVYTPIIEGIVNSIHSIEQSGRKDGEIVVNIKRSKQKALAFDADALADISEIEISDNGVGFTDENRVSFDTIYSSLKIEKGGKGFGRFSFIKYFESVSVDSIYEKEGEFFRRQFNFATKGEDLIEDETNELTKDTKVKTTICLKTIKKGQRGKMEKKIETISRKIVESLLVLFADDNYECPKITIKDETGNHQVLNDYIDKHKEIEIIYSEDFSLTKTGEKDEKFRVKVFKIYYSKSNNSTRLVAHNREVTDTPLSEYIPEFADEFFDEVENDKEEKVKKNYAIKVYVMGKYLDDNVSLERHTFEFSRADNLLENFSFSQSEIEEKASQIAKKIFEKEVRVREERKIERIKEYVQKDAPWHKPLINSLDLTKIPYKGSNLEMETELQKARFVKELRTQSNIRQILNNESDFSDKVAELINEITDIGKSDLTHYVALRRTVLDLFKKSLEIKEDGKYELEKTVHDIIFPMGKDSENSEYEKHNLWIIDERLSFHEYVSSDKPLQDSKERPDIVVFDNRIAVRGDNELSNPIVVFEFKRPQRETYKEEDNPIKQIANYIEQIRLGKCITPKGRNIRASKETPAYGFLVCDITPKIEEFCRDAQLHKTPDGLGYYGYHQAYGVYFEVVNFDKVVKDAELRNRIFFKKLGLE